VREVDVAKPFLGFFGRFAEFDDHESPPGDVELFCTPGTDYRMAAVSLPRQRCRYRLESKDDQVC
jgi:hypothetical protein